MKRWALRILVLLVLGAIVSVAVAWGIARFHWWPDPQFTNWATEVGDWPRSVPEHWPSQAKTMRVAGLTRTIDRAVQDEYRGPESKRVTVTFLIDIYSYGIPCRALTTESWQEAVIGATISYRTDGHPARSAWRNGVSVPSSTFALPIRPIWPGFAINTVFYAVVLWLLFAAPFALRRLRGGRRIKRGLCPKCAYDLRGAATQSSVCPECGSMVAS